MDWQSIVADVMRRHAPDVDTSAWWPPPAAAEAPRQADSHVLHMHAIDAADGTGLRSTFDAFWPAYRRWYLRPERRPRPTVDEARTALQKHMPELVPVWESLTRQLNPNDEVAARFLSAWDPPPLTSNCSQAVLRDGRLVRNYDYDPSLFDAVVLRSRWLRPVLGTADQVWGLLDGVNDAGLAASFTFGGRPDVGRGFGIPLVMRYILETCTTTHQACATLLRLPVHVTYNVTVVDVEGDAATVYVGPSRRASASKQRATTNHQERVHWPQHARRFGSVERLQRLESVLFTASDDDDVVQAFLSPPLRSTRYEDGFVTLYTAEYLPTSRSVTYHWPTVQWRHSLASALPTPPTLPTPLVVSLDSDAPVDAA